jgi:hypothetical protein
MRDTFPETCIGRVFIIQMDRVVIVYQIGKSADLFIGDLFGVGKCVA